MPLISIITSTYNSERYLKDLIRSLRDQTFFDFEWIIIDGGSTDSTLEITNLNSDIIKYTSSEPDTGIYNAWNKGLKVARGEWICFIGSDDFFISPDSLQGIAEILRSSPPTTKIIYSKVLITNESCVPLYTIGEPWYKAKKKFRSLMTLPHPGLMHHKSLFRDYGYFDESYRIAGDYEFLLRATKLETPFFNTGPPLVSMRLGGISSSSKHQLSSLFEVRRATKQHGGTFPSMHLISAFGRLSLRSLIVSIFGNRNAAIALDFGRSLMGKKAHWTRLR